MYAVMALNSCVPAMPANNMRGGLSVIPCVISMISPNAQHAPTKAPPLMPSVLPPTPSSITQTAPSEAPEEIPRR